MNYETRTAMLWLNNDENLYGHFSKRAKSIHRDMLAGEIEAFFQSDLNEISDNQPHVALMGMFKDILTASVGEMDFDGLANAFYED
ncbi:hypothetical protein UFOVP142_70 [uncultured Caudovirales phage]|uniref:Uncharacterized protein n=1 Tax=uncultured Caudovirales phage TaxID=2100421 RepID=A0A6J7XNE2_9CAUD|nr:hypothetical protein UFOVP142_70 [uncultured Caudovirales phage]